MANQNFRVKHGLEVGTGGIVLTATQSGKIGVGGVTSPTSTLDVGGDVNISSNINVTGVSTVTGIATFKNNVSIDGNLYFTDDKEIKVGESSLQLKYISSTQQALIRNTNASGSLIIDTADGSSVKIANSSGGESMGVFNTNGSVELYYDNVKKFETNSGGVLVTGITTTSELHSTGQVLVSGISTFVGVGTFQNDLYISGNVSSLGNLELGGGVASSGIITATAFHTGAEGSSIRVTSDTISGPSTINIDPSGIGDNTGLVVIKGDLQIDGTTTTVNSTTVTVDDKNIVLGSGAANDAAADGGGITLESGDGNKTFNWVDGTDSWTSSENLDLASGKTYKIGTTDVLSSTTLGSTVVNSSLTSVGTLGSLNVTGTVSAGGFSGPLTGDVTGNVTGTASTSTNINISSSSPTDTTLSVVMVESQSIGGQSPVIKTGFLYNPISNTLATNIVAQSGVSTFNNIVVTGLSTDGSNYGTASYVPVADGSGAWTWSPVSAAGGGSLNGITINEESTVVGTSGGIINIDFVGDNITATGSGTNATVTLSNDPSFGSVNVTGIVTASSFVRSGGSSSEFLKADGTVDSSAYIQLSSLSVGTPASASGSGSIAYNNSNGEFTYTPPDLSSYLTSYTETQTLDDVLTLGNTTSLGITAGSINLSGIATATSLRKYNELIGSDTYSDVVEYAVTVSAKTANHRYNGQGSSSGYYVDGIESPHITFVPGKTYKFDQSDSSNGFHDLRFYLDAAKTTQWTTGVTSNGSAGSAGAYTQIVVDETTPTLLYYQCVNHGYMGNSVSVPTKTIHTDLDINTLANVNAQSFVKSGGSSSEFLKADGSVDSSTYLTTFTETDPVVAAINGIVKSDGATIAAAVAGTDYLAPAGDGSSLTGIVTSITAGSGISIDQSTGNVTISGSVVGSIDDLSDVDTSSVAPSEGQTLLWDSANSKWEPGTVSGLPSVNAIIPVALAHITQNNYTANSGTGISWGTYQYSAGNYGYYEFTFDVAQPDVNYTVITDMGVAGDANISPEVSNKTTTGFRVNMYSDSTGNELAVGTVATNELIVLVYGSDPRSNIAVAAGAAEIRDGGSSVGIATIIDFGTNLSVSPISAGIVTITSSISGDGSALTGIVTSITAGSGISIDQSTGNVTITASGGGGSVGAALTVKQTQGNGGTEDVSVSSVSTLIFDANTGFNVTDNGNGEVFVDLGSAFAPWYIDGQDDLIPDGEESIEIIAGPGIALTTKATATGIGTGLSKALTINADFSISTASASGNGSLSYDNTTGAFTYTPPDLSAAGGGIALTDLSVTTNPVGTAALTYNNVSGVFTYTPPDLSSYLTSISSADLSGISIDALSDVDTTSTAPTNGQALIWDGANWAPADITATAAPTAVDYGETFPTTGLSEGDLFYNSTYGKIFVRFDGFWVDASPNLQARPDWGNIDEHAKPALDNTYDLGSFSKRWRNIYTTDLNLSNEGKQNDVDGTWGKWTIQEGEDDLFIINRRNGKKYKFTLQEV